MGALLSAGSHQLIDGKEPIEEPKAVAQSCFIAAMLYAVLFVFSYCQSYLINKEAAAERTFTSI
ncbi:hypothetical protein HDU97_005397 [Phlyctochytrium planicorne]|nr:hypothetical protein HDU97_005397 [Phlyctochytrium planicorne]